MTNKKEKKEWHVVSFSGGKDSTAMLLGMLDRGMQVDDIIFCDTEMEFDEMYDHIKQVEDYIGRKITILHFDKSFEYMLFEQEVKSGKYKGQIGLNFPNIRYRWCTNLKEKAVRKYRKLHKDKKIIMYVGFASDEPKRVKKDRYPLIDWGMTEQDALNYCYERGFTWGGLYEKFNRVSCWCCPLQNLKSAKALREHFPEKWNLLKSWEKRLNKGFRLDYNTDELEEKFDCEARGEKYRRKKNK